MEEQDVEHTQTLYTILNVSETASIEEIKRLIEKRQLIIIQILFGVIRVMLKKK